MSLDDTQSSRRSLGLSQCRKLRYKSLLEDLSTLDDDDENHRRMEKTASAVNEAKVILFEGGLEEKVKHPGEAFLDSRLLRATSDLAVRCSEAVSGNINTYDKHELAQHIKENPLFWQFSLPNEVPSMLSIFGTFAPTPLERRPRAVRRRIEKQQLGALTAPESVDKLDEVEEGNEMVQRVKRKIEQLYHAGRGKPLSYFHVVLDPASFGRTVENVYHVSFLVRDGMVAIHLDAERELPFITPISEDDPRDNTEENQFLVSIDMQRWQELIKAFRIRRPMMVLK